MVVAQNFYEYSVISVNGQGMCKWKVSEYTPIPPSIIVLSGEGVCEHVYFNEMCICNKLPEYFFIRPVHHLGERGVVACRIVANKAILCIIHHWKD